MGTIQAHGTLYYYQTHVNCRYIGFVPHIIHRFSCLLSSDFECKPLFKMCKENNINLKISERTGV